MTDAKEIMIAAFIPSFAERDVLWFSENAEKIKKLARADSFWKEHILFLEEGERVSMSEFLRSLDSLHYEKVQTVAAHGEFSTLGGTVTVFPLNSDRLTRIEFLGNTVERITPLEQKEIAQDKREKLLKKEMFKREISHLHNLKEGDFVVHLDHGIGIFRGMFESPTPTEGNPTSFSGKYYLLEYAPPKDSTEHDKLYVPESQVKKLSRYLGLEQPTIHRLSGTVWEHAKKKVSEDAIRLAKELLELYALRHQARRTPYPALVREQHDFDARFEHVETHDQQQAIEDVLADMQKTEPMDRLVCGDVGFGKTEVAMRAAFAAVYAGKQVAVLCPTTVLADQHYETFKNRFAKFPVAIGMLSRFETKQAQKETVRKLKEGKVDIVIGTHRILSKDVAFKNVGLLIIDEEQRFGVRQKEKLKAMRENIDVLSLSATPIPRTLYLALSGMRAISTITTPPLGRQTIETFILPYSKDVIRKAIEYERGRRGQVYFLHNKIETIEKVKETLKELVPKAKFEAVHGRVGEARLRAVMRAFKEKKFDVLVATTIIENGLDIKNANTLIVDDATRLGLAQAYQIRGRIGRAEHKAHAYFLYPSKVLSEDAKKRLEALKEATELGAGYFIAQRDLEIRGAGNILGKKQSGSVNAVGLNLYCQMLADAVESLQNFSH
ncbi:MAG: DEAD/DEAH box helicase [Patescibacteria group bacterium]